MFILNRIATGASIPRQGELLKGVVGEAGGHADRAGFWHRLRGCPECKGWAGLSSSLPLATH